MKPIVLHPVKIIPLLVLLLVSNFASAGWETPLVVAKRGNEIVSHPTDVLMEIGDPYVGLVPPHAFIPNRYIDIGLRLDETQRDYFGHDWKLKITYTIKFYDMNDSYVSQLTNETLEIDYKHTSGSFTDRSLNRYSGKAKAELVVTGIEFTEYPGPVTYSDLSSHNFSSLTLEMIYQVERYIHLHPNPTDDLWHYPDMENVGAPALNEVTIGWTTILGAESYDVEWMFIDVPPGVDFDAESIGFDWRDATRINTADVIYKFALVYPRGIFAYRVRGVGKKWDPGQGKLINEYGPWSSSNTTYFANTGSAPNYFYWNGFEPLINWTSAIDYAEEGKKKEIVSFYDGSGRMRQTVTMLNTDHNAVVAETYYDHAGRAAVNALPTPVKDGWIKYYPSFNGDFGRNYFDEQTQLASTGPEAMTTGATNEYYSSSNPFLGDYSHINQIPKADGYPYVQTRVMNDGTGRPHSTSGVGFTHKLKGGHATLYFYASPGGQEELDRLFGSEAGFVENYKKNMVVDANGQISVTYLDGYGRTVATALAGDASELENLHALDSPGPESITVSLLSANTVEDAVSRTVKDFLVTVYGQYTFEYSLTQQDVELACWTDNDQKPCRFDLQIRIFKEEEGELHEQGTGISLAGIKEAVTETLSVNLEPGKYVVMKELRLSNDTLDTLASHLNTFLQPNPYAIPDPVPGDCFAFSGTVMPCFTCAENCTTSYTVPLVLNNGTTITLYRNPQNEWFFPPSGYNGTTITHTTVSLTNPNVIFDETMSSNLQAAMEACVANCSSEVTVAPLFDECDMMRKVLIADMEPNGQYFDNKRSLEILNAITDPGTATAYLDNDYNGDDPNEQKNRYYWINRFVPDGMQQDLADMAEITWADDDYDFWSELASLWESKIKPHPDYPTIQNGLLTLHPEYCTHYYFCVFDPAGECCTNLSITVPGPGDDWRISCSVEGPGPEIEPNTMSSREYDIAMLAVNDFSEAVAGNWFNPLNLPDVYTLGLASTSDPLNQDPYFCPNGWAGGAGLTNLMLNHLMHFYPTPADTSIKMSIYEVLTWDPGAYTPPGSPPAYHDEVLAFLYYLHGDGGSIVGLLDDSYDTPGIDGSGNHKMSRWDFFKQQYIGKKKMLIRAGYTPWAKANCAGEEYANFPIAATDCGPSNPTGNLTCANDCYLVSRDVNGDLTTDMGEFNTSGIGFEGFDARYQFFCLPENIAGFANDFCENMAEAYAYQWLNQIQNPFIGCASAQADLSEFLAEHGTVRDELLAYLRAYFLHSCGLQVLTPPTASSPADLNFGTLTTPVAVSTLFPSPAFTWDVPSGLTHISSPGDILLIFIEELENEYGYALSCPEELYTPPFSISPTLQPGEVPEMHDPEAIVCPCSKFAEWIMNTDGAFETGLTPEIFNPIRYEAFGESDLTFLEMTVLADALDELDAGLGSSLNIGHFIGYCRHPETYGQVDGNGFGPTDIPEAFRCNGVQGASPPLGCAELNAVSDAANNLNAYRQDVQNFVDAFRNNYTSTCLGAIVSRETFTMQYALNEYHYTLYYYDQAGNLIKTVPPEGVEILGSGDVASSIAYRSANHTDGDYAYDNSGTPNVNFVWPAHRMVTNYRYNSSNQPVFQHTPDGGDSRFWYDRLGRMVLSQNAKQATPVNGKVSYSYTLYDWLGRISEVGQLNNKPVDSPPDDALTSDPGALSAFIGPPSNRRQVTRTHYDTPAQMVIPGFLQQNVRNRVSRTEFAEDGGNAINFITYYSYDIHGNVNELVHQVTALQTFNRKFIKTTYDYDLVSGNVNKVTYQPGMPEMFIHRYEYDADNRLVEVRTSRDNVLWDLDAKYIYYPHGPLARIEIGEKQVQGIDYAYTLHGWLKAVNGIRLAANNVADPLFDIGHDGAQSITELHTQFARDAYGFSLFYYGAADGGQRPDYSPIDDMEVFVDRDMENQLDVTDGVLGFGLYNGNIASMTTALRKPDETAVDALRKTYQYDQLNRLVQSNSFLSVSASEDGFTPDDKYTTRYVFDANGNIVSMERNGATGNPIDQLSYYYNHDINNHLINNRLMSVDDAAGYGGEGDLDGQAANNYSYDAIGNLVGDVAEEIEKIEWNVYGKVKSVIRSTGSEKPNLEFFYDPSGQRYAKVEKPLAGTSPQGLWKYTFYLRDAQGNPLCIYKAGKASNTSQYQLVAAEHPIYGSARLGMDVNEVTAGYSISAPTFSVGIKPRIPDRFNNHAIMGAGTLTIGEGIRVKTWLGENTYTPEDFMYYRNEGFAEITYEAPVLMKSLMTGDPPSDLVLYMDGTAYDWNGVLISVHDGEWYMFGGTLDSSFTESDIPYDIDSAYIDGGFIRTGALTLHKNAHGVYAMAPGTTGHPYGVDPFDNEGFFYASNIVGNDEFILRPTEGDSVVFNGDTLKFRASVFYTTNMRADEFLQQIPDSIGYSFDESVLILPGGQEVHQIFNTEIFQRDDSLENNFTNSTIKTGNFLLRYWSATDVPSTDPGVLFKQHIDSLMVVQVRGRFNADSIEIVRNDTVFGGVMLSSMSTFGTNEFRVDDVDIPGFGTVPYGVPLAVNWINLRTSTFDDDGLARMYSGSLTRDSISGRYVFNMTGPIQFLPGYYSSLPDSTEILATQTYYGNVEGTLLFWEDSISFTAWDGNVLVDNIFFDPVIAHAGISCGLFDSIITSQLTLTWLHPWTTDPLTGYHGIHYEDGTLFVTLDSVPMALAHTGYCNIAVNYSGEGSSPGITGLQYVLVGNEMQIAFRPDTVHLPFAATWRTQTGVYFRTPFIYSDSGGCYLESRDAVRFYAGLNIMALPYDNPKRGVSELMVFDAAPTVRMYAHSELPSTTEALATVLAVDTNDRVVYKGLHSFVWTEEGQLVFAGHPMAAAYLYLGAAADDTVDINGHSAFLTHSDYRMGMGTFVFWSPDSLYGVFPVENLHLETDMASLDIGYGTLMAMGNHWMIKSQSIENVEVEDYPLKQVTALRPRTAGMAERIITGGEFAEVGLFDNAPDQSGWNDQWTIPVTVTPCPTCKKGTAGYKFVAGKKIYELSNHLGNVLNTISDRKLQASGTDGIVDYYLPDVLTMTDYDPYGMSLSGRTESQGDIKYRFGFGSQEKDDEVYGEGNSYTAEFWQYDPRLGRRWNLDPVDQIHISNYAVFENNPIYNKDEKGDIIDPFWLTDKEGNYVNFKSGYLNYDNFKYTGIGLFTYSDVFRNTIKRLQASKTHYSIKQYNYFSVSARASYDDKTKTINLYAQFPGRGGLYEEVFHAGQDDYYSEKGDKRSYLALEVEAKIAKIADGLADGDRSIIGDYNSIKNYFKTGEKDKDFDKELDKIIKDVHDVYTDINGSAWGTENKPEDINKDKLFDYLNSVREKDVSVKEE